MRLVIDPALVRRKLPGAEAPLCRYRALAVKPGGDFNTTATQWSGFFRDSIEVGPGEEHFVVECRKIGDPQSPLVAKSYVSVVRERPDLEKTLHERMSKHKNENAVKETLNVLVLGIDGMSKQNMVRTLPKTRDFLLGTLKAKEMLNYNKNGMNTFPNVITMLTGKTVAEISSEYSWNTGKFFDDIPFVWDEFAKAGYRTQVALDSSRVTSFHCSKQGFSRPPVHYYHRPLVLESEQDADVRHKDGNCVGDVPEVTLLLDYVLQMAATSIGAHKKGIEGVGADNAHKVDARSAKHHTRNKRSLSDEENISSGNNMNRNDDRTKMKDESKQGNVGTNTNNINSFVLGNKLNRPNVVSANKEPVKEGDIKHFKIDRNKLHDKGSLLRQKQPQLNQQQRHQGLDTQQKLVLQQQQHNQQQEEQQQLEKQQKQQHQLEEEKQQQHRQQQDEKQQQQQQQQELQKQQQQQLQEEQKQQQQQQLQKKQQQQHKQQQRQQQQQVKQQQQQQHQEEQQQQQLAPALPFFSYNFLVRLTHDNPQRASAGDLLYEKFFRSLHATGALNTTVLVFFSDHGPRFGPLR